MNAETGTVSPRSGSWVGWLRAVLPSLLLVVTWAWLGLQWLQERRAIQRAEIAIAKQWKSDVGALVKVRMDKSLPPFAICAFSVAPALAEAEVVGVKVGRYAVTVECDGGSILKSVTVYRDGDGIFGATRKGTTDVFPGAIWMVPERGTDAGRTVVDDDLDGSFDRKFDFPRPKGRLD